MGTSCRFGLKPRGTVKWQVKVPDVIKQHLCVYCSYLGGERPLVILEMGNGVKHVIDSFLYHITHSSLAFILFHMLFPLPQWPFPLSPPTKLLLTLQDHLKSFASPDTPRCKDSRVPICRCLGGNTTPQGNAPVHLYTAALQPALLSLPMPNTLSTKATDPGAFLRAPELCSSPLCGFVFLIQQICFLAITILL